MEHNENARILPAQPSHDWRGRATSAVDNGFGADPAGAEPLEPKIMRLKDKTAIVVGAGQGPGTGMGNGRAVAGSETWSNHGLRRSNSFSTDLNSSSRSLRLRINAI
jgi:hypothetical protein